MFVSDGAMSPSHGHHVLPVARARSGIRGHNSAKDVVADLAPTWVVFSDVADPAALLVADLSAHGPVHTAIYCFGSRGGAGQGRCCSGCSGASPSLPRCRSRSRTFSSGRVIEHKGLHLLGGAGQPTSLALSPTAPLRCSEACPTGQRQMVQNHRKNQQGT